MFYDKNAKPVELTSYCGRHEGMHIFRATVTFHPGSEHQSARIRFISLDSLVPGSEDDMKAVAKVPSESLNREQLRFAIKEARQ